MIEEKLKRLEDAHSRLYNRFNELEEKFNKLNETLNEYWVPTLVDKIKEVEVKYQPIKFEIGKSYFEIIEKIISKKTSYPNWSKIELKLKNNPQLFHCFLPDNTSIKDGDEIRFTFEENNKLGKVK